MKPFGEMQLHDRFSRLQPRPTLITLPCPTTFRRKDFVSLSIDSGNRSAMESVSRTVSDYTCFFEGEAIAGLSGQVVERGGPGDNTNKGKDKHLHIRKGTYPLAIQGGNHFKTFRFEELGLLPGLLLEETDKRSGILIHPCHDQANRYLSSIGCFNPAKGLTDADSRVNLADSKARVIAIIDGMKEKYGSKFPKSGRIPKAVVLIERVA
jgi:hypothetical protein